MIPTFLSVIVGAFLMTQASGAPPRDGPQLEGPAAEAMVALLDKERQSKATYDAILAEHRPLPPFGRIAREEVSHETKLVADLRRLAVEIPPNRWADAEIDVPDDADAARELGAKLERETIAAYVDAIKVVEDEALKAELRQLRTESRQHLRMFENCCGMGSGQGQGLGQGRGPGAGRGAGPGAGGR